MHSANNAVTVSANIFHVIFHILTTLNSYWLLFTGREM